MTWSPRWPSGTGGGRSATLVHWRAPTPPRPGWRGRTGAPGPWASNRRGALRGDEGAPATRRPHSPEPHDPPHPPPPRGPTKPVLPLAGPSADTAPRPSPRAAPQGSRRRTDSPRARAAPHPLDLAPAGPRPTHHRPDRARRRAKDGARKALNREPGPGGAPLLTAPPLS